MRSRAVYRQHMLRIISLAIALFVLPAVSASGQDFDKGLTAAQSGDYATALREWTPLAEQGNAAAQTNLGVMYDNGQGVPQDYAAAVRWYRLAAEQGYAAAQSNLGPCTASELASFRTTSALTCGTISRDHLAAMR